MKIIIQLSFYILLSINALYGQSAKISGKVFDNIKTSLPYATVILKNSENKLIEGLVTNEDGKFNFSNVKKGTYILKVEYIGFKDFLKKIVIKGATQKIKLERIVLNEDSKKLDEIVVEGVKSEVSLKLGKKVFRVGKDITSQNGAATDVLNNVPSVNVSPTGTVSLRGNSNVQILINGRRSGLTQAQALEQLPADTIESIEVITNPSAKYDASGGAGIINIILKKNKLLGVNGQVRLVAGVPDDYRLLGNINYKTDRFNFFSNLGIRYTDYEGDYTKNQRTTDNGITTLINKIEDEDRHDDGQIYYFGSDFYMNEKNTITLAYYRNQTKDTDKTELMFDLSNSLNENSSLLTLGNSKEKRAYNQLEANYTKMFDKKGRKLTVDFQYDFWNSNKIWNLKTDEVFPVMSNVNTLQTDGKTDTNDFKVQSDYSSQINKKINFETGIKFENRTITNSFLAEELINGNYEIIDDIKNSLDYKERIVSAYAQINGNKNKFNYQFGLRLEDTDLSINSLKSVFNVKNKYANLFPSATIGYKFTDSFSGQMSYSKRIKRPSLWQLNPFFELKDFTSRFTGNPLLNPSFTNSYELSSLYRNKGFSLSSSVYYSKTKNVFQTEVTQNAEGVFIQSPINLSNEDRIGLEISSSYKPYKWLNFSGDFNMYKFEQTGVINNTNSSISDDTWFINFSTNIRPTKTLNIQTRLYHIGKRENLQIQAASITYINFAVSKSILKNKGKIIFNISNPFNSSKIRENIIGNNFEIAQVRNRNAQRFSLSFMYKFNQKSSNQNRHAKRSNRN